MKTLIVEDDFTSRLLLQKILGAYGPYCLAEDGCQAVEAVRVALKLGKPFDLICLDIMMPEMDGQTALKQIRDLEEANGIESTCRAKIIMTTALADRANVINACQQQCDYYLIKPIDKARLLDEMRKLGLISLQEGGEGPCES